MPRSTSTKEVVTQLTNQEPTDGGQSQREHHVYTKREETWLRDGHTTEVQRRVPYRERIGRRWHSSGNHRRVGSGSRSNCKHSFPFPIPFSDFGTDAWMFSSKHEAGAVGYCKIGCGYLDDFDHMIVLLAAFSGVLLVIMWVARKRTL